MMCSTKATLSIKEAGKESSGRCRAPVHNRKKPTCDRNHRSVSCFTKSRIRSFATVLFYLAFYEMFGLRFYGAFYDRSG